MPYITKINSLAFQNCKNLELAYAPNVKIIGMSAFAMCTSLNDIIFPSTLETVGSSVFMMSTTKIHARFDAVQSEWASNWNAGNKIQIPDFNGVDAEGYLWKHDFVYEELFQTNPRSRSTSVKTRLAPLQPFMENKSQGHLEIPATDLDLTPFTFVEGTFDSITVLSGTSPINIWSSAFVNIKVNEGITINRDVTYNCGFQESGISETPFNTVDTPFITLPSPKAIVSGSEIIVPGMFHSNTIQNLNFRTAEGIIYENLGVVKLPEGIQKIETEAFYATNNIKHLHIPSSVTTIGKEAFSQWNKTQTIYVPFFSEAQADSVLGVGWKVNNSANIEYAGEVSIILQPTEITDSNTHNLIFEFKVNKNKYTLDQFTSTAKYSYDYLDPFVSVLNHVLVKTDEVRGDYLIRRWEYKMTLKPTSNGGSNFTFTLNILKDDAIITSVTTQRITVHKFICTAADFNDMDFTISNYNIYLLNNIDLGTYTNSITRCLKLINNANFYGNNHTITYEIEQESMPIGYSYNLSLFEENNGTISDLKVNATLTVSNYESNIDENGEQSGSVACSGVALKNNANALIKNCEVTINIDINCPRSDMGGVSVRNAGLIYNCVIKGSIYSTALNLMSTGGVATYNFDGKITSCTNKATINSYGNSGGISAQNSSEISNCINEGTIIYNYKYFNSGIYSNRSTGGIVGFNQGSCTNSKNTGIIMFGKSENPDQWFLLQPAMGLIIGTNDGGNTGFNILGGTVDTGSLFNANGHEQTLYAKNAECGRIM